MDRDGAGMYENSQDLKCYSDSQMCGQRKLPWLNVPDVAVMYRQVPAVNQLFLTITNS